MDAKPALQTSSTANPIDISITDKATHVYVKNENTLGLQPKFCGPYLITSRPSRSTVEVRVGSFVDGRPRLQKFHWSHCKIAHMRPDAEAAERPGPGRPRTSTRPDSPKPTDDVENKSDATENKQNSTGRSRQKIQTSAGKSLNSSDSIITQEMFNKWSPDMFQTLRRSARSTRNPNPSYIDALNVTAG